MASQLSALHVVASINANTGGPAASVTGLASAVARRGVRTTVASLDYAEHGRPLAAPGVSNIAVVPSRVGKGLRGWSPALGKAVIDIVADGVDVIHNHGLWMYPGIYARRAAVRFGVPLVISPRGMLDSWSLERSARSKALAAAAYEHRNLRSARVLHATSGMEADAIRRYGLSQPIAVIPNGVELPEGMLLPREHLEARFPELRGRRWLLFMGRLHAKKGIDLLLAAWSALNSDFPDWHLVLAGPDLDGYGAELASNLARVPRLGERVTLTGMIEGSTKRAFLGHSDLFVLPTRSENFGITVAEALASGTPAITTTAAPWSELETRRCGWWVAPESAPITQALRSAMSLDPNERKAMGDRGRIYASEFSWDAIGARMVEVYQWIAVGGAVPACVRES